MKNFKRLFSFLLCLVMLLSISIPAFAKSTRDEEEDYSVSDVYFDVTDDRILVGWTVGDSKCSYTVQLYNSKDFKSKNKVGGAVTVSYNAENCDVTDKILKKGSGTYYAVVTCKKKPKGNSSYASAWTKESISSDDLSSIRAKRKTAETTESSASAASGSGVHGVDGGPGISTTNGSASNSVSGWSALPDGKWAYIRADGTRATGWYEAGGRWYYSDAEGIMSTSAWIHSETETNVWYYVGEDGAMLTDSTTPDGYRVNSEGKYWD